MRKRLLSLAVLLFFCLTGFSNENQPEENPKYPVISIDNPTVSIPVFTCAVTRSASYTVSGFDCNNMPWSVTTSGSCTATLQDCEGANLQAYACAWGNAYQSAQFYLLLRSDCP